MAASNQVFSAFSFLSFVLVTIPFVWHLQGEQSALSALSSLMNLLRSPAWNTGTCIYMGWVSLTSLLLFINSVVWNDNTVNWAPIYCDIATKIMIGAAVGVVAATLCINRRLYYIVSIKSVMRTVAEVSSLSLLSSTLLWCWDGITLWQKRREVLVDLAIGVGIPIIVMILRELHTDATLEPILTTPTTTRRRSPGTSFRHLRRHRLLANHLQHSTSLRSSLRTNTRSLHRCIHILYPLHHLPQTQLCRLQKALGLERNQPGYY